MSGQYVGIDLHRRRSVIVRTDENGDRLSCVRVANDDTAAISAELAAAGDAPEVVLEATYGWYWMADMLADAGATVHLAHPLGCNWGHRRVKNDERDASDLVDLLRLGRLAEAWIAPDAVRQLRELVRYRAKLVAFRTNLKAQAHAVLAKEGVTVPMTDVFGVAGTAMVHALELGDAYRTRIDSLRELIAAIDSQRAQIEQQITGILAGHAGYHAIQAIPGVGPVLAAIFVAEIGDVSRFASADKLACWAGLTPRHRESDTKVHRGRITKQGSRLMRWAAVEAAHCQRADTFLRADYNRIVAAKGRTPSARRIANVAIARKIVTLVFYGLRDGEIRCLADHQTG